MNTEQYLEKIKAFERELRTRDDEITLAAKYGKQLLEDKRQLKSQIEALNQENYALQLKLEAQSKSNESQILEIESQKDAINENESELQYFKKENQIINKKFQEKSLQAEELKKATDDLYATNNSCKEKIAQLESELRTYREQVQVSLNETNSEEYQKLTSDLQTCQEEKMSLLSHSSEMELKLGRLQSQEEKYISLIESLKQGLEERDHEIQSYSIMIQKAREENSELLGQIEILKLEQLDINRKGNSIFSEVEDRRKLVEKELIITRKKYEAMQENYNIRLTELRKVKHQMSIFLGMFSQKADYNYMDDLENSLRAAKKEIEYLTKSLNEEINSRHSHSLSPILNDAAQPDSQYNYLRALLAQSQKRNDELEKELQSLRMSKLAESDELIQTKQALYRSQTTVDNLKGEVLQLKLKLQDLLMKPGDVKQQEPEAKKEIIPGFKPLDQKNGSVPSCQKIKEKKSCKKSVTHSKENWDFFEALKNPTSSKARKNIFNDADDSDINNSSVDRTLSPVKRTEKVNAPIVVMNDGSRNECAQQ